MSIDKSTRQHYAMQGGGPNYLGKQKMVKAPKKWISSPDHETAELAYITKKEKDILLDLNIYGSLKNGKPNRGPSGIISLQGDMGSIGGGGGPSGGGGGGRDRHPPAPRPTPRPHTPAPKPTPTRAPDFITGRDLHKDPVAIDQGFVDTKPKPKTYTPPIRNIHEDTGKEEEAFEMVGGVKVPLSMRGVKGVDPREDPERYFEKVEGPDLRTEKEKDEDLERATDWDKVKDLSKKGYDFTEIQDAMDKGLLTKADPQSMKTGLLDRGIRSIRNIIPKTGLEKSLLSKLTKNVFSPTTGGLFDLKGMATGALKSMALKKLGLGALNPILGIASLFGFDPLKSITNKFARKPAFDMEEASKLGLYANRYPTQTTDTRTAKARDAYTPPISTQIAGGKNVITENIARFTGKDTGGKSMMEDFYANQGSWSERLGDQLGTNLQQAKNVGPALIQMRNLERKIKAPDIYGEPTEEEKRMYKKSLERDKEEKVYRTPILTAAHGGRIDRPLMGRRRDI